MTQDKQHNRPNVPPLRFPEFTDEWKTYKVSDVLDFYSTNSLSWDQLEYSDGELRNLHYGLIHVGLPTLVNLKDDLLPTIKEGNTPKNYTLCLNGDVAFADASEDTNDVAKAIELVETDGNKVVFGLHTIHGRDNKGLTTLGFKGYAFSSKVFHDQIKCIAQGTKIYSISSKNFSECYIGIPNKAEQSKIARLLSLLDRRIAVQSGLINKLESLISGIGQRVFLHFNSFEKLGNVAKITNGNSDVQDAIEIYESGLYPFYDRSDVIKYLNTYYLDKEAIIYAGEGSEFFPRYHNGKFALHQRCYAIFDFKEEYLPKFIYYYMFTLNGYFVRNSVGSTVPSLRMGTFEKVNIPKVPVKQQLYIIKVFDCLHKKLHQAKQTKRLFEMQKQYLLQQMFI